MLPDYLEPLLNVVFVGTAVAEKSVERGHYYSGPNNAFWRLLNQSGLADDVLRPEDDIRITTYGIGLTDLVKARSSRNDQLLDQEDLALGVAPFLGKIKRVNPRFVCFNGMNAYQAFRGQRARSWGLTGDKIGESRVFVVPSTSGRVNEGALFDGQTRLGWFKALAKLAGESVEIVARQGEGSDPIAASARAERPRGAAITLHEEISEILARAKGDWLSTQEVADRVNARARYHKRDGSQVTAFQIHGRTRKYSDMFERDGSRVRLRRAE